MSKERQPQGPVEKIYEIMPEDGEVVIEGFVGMFLGVVEVNEEMDDS